MAVTHKPISTFEQQTGVKVKLVGVDENQLPQLVESAAAAGKLPDVMGGIPLAPVWQMYSNGLIDTDATAKVLTALGRSTFNPNALKLASDGSKPLAVPSDSWQQILVYRKDLFAKAHLATPDSYDAIVKAAQALNKGSVSGISLATDPKDVFTQQSFEDFAVANDCQMVTSGGKVSLDSPQCTAAFTAYDKLAATGPAGTQTVDTTRATYQAGQSAMVVWSTYLLDSLAGLRNDVLPNCPPVQGRQDVPVQELRHRDRDQGPGRRRTQQFGEISSWTITEGRAHRRGREVRPVHDVQRLRGLARDGARGQDTRTQRNDSRAQEVRHRLARNEDRRGHSAADGQAVPRLLPRPTAGRRQQHAALGDHPRPGSAGRRPVKAHCRFPRPSAR